MGKECPGCGNAYESLGLHLYRSECEYPDLSREQCRIVEGMMLGDGSLSDLGEENKNPYLTVSMTNFQFLRWLKSRFPTYANSLIEVSGSKHSTKAYYELSFMRSPIFAGFSDWYENPQKTAEQVELSPMSLKMWYVSDGWLYLNSDCDRPNLLIGNRNINNRESTFSAIFEPLDVEPWVYDDMIEFSVGDTEKLFEYMGGPVVGFKNKWPDGYKADDNQDTIV